MLHKLLIVTCLVHVGLMSAQVTFPVNGVRHPDIQVILIQNANIHQDTSRVVFTGEILIKDGKIAQIGKSVEHPKEAVVIDMMQKHIYPSFIDPLTSYGIPELKRNSGANVKISTKEGAFSWNEALRCEIKASSIFTHKEEDAAKFREAGFGIVQTHQADGISRGSACIVSLHNANEHQLILKSESGHVMSFQKGSSSQEYPSSLMGSIALLRQSYLDGKQYEKAIKPFEVNLSIEAWNYLQTLPQFFTASSPLDILRAQTIAKEFNTQFIIKGNGKEYQKAEFIKQPNTKLIIPLNFPSVYEVDDPYDALQIDLSDLKHWETAPANAAILAKRNIPFIFTSQDLKDRKDFLSNVKKAIQHGLSEEQALYATTQGPAEFLGIQQLTGSLAAGKLANFIVTDGNLFAEKTNIKENWIQGNRFNFQKQQYNVAHSGVYKFTIDTTTYLLHIKSTTEKSDISLQTIDSVSINSQCKIQGDYLTGTIQRKHKSGTCLLSASTSPQGFMGSIQLEDGSWKNIILEKLNTQSNEKPKPDSATTQSPKEYGNILYPFTAYGWAEKPKQRNYLITNATVWTNEKDGILKNTDILIRDGKIAQVGKKLSYPDAIIIDGTGKHITAGIIDEHSHIAVNGAVNECSESVTSEVRIGDVINSEDINIYRQLAGGVTCAQLLHGSCNPVGGQSAIIKMRWGASPEQLKNEHAKPFIKFALGENVKRSGGNEGQRFPDTRMGVEQVYLDAFSRARDYEALRKTKPEETRRDLRLEALAEIINKKRFISCHSYVQSEINMMMKVAERFNFTLNTFTHILEGYKVADIMKKHGAGAAGFADWWAYKFEVYEAIPYNGAILHNQGVLTAFNSDDAEMARRLNQEAAKAVMYGNVPEEEALKFVTLNPAKLLHIDDKVGSIKTGKDADLVLWNDHPLSIKASADITFVDGIKYYDKETDMQLRKDIANERNRIIQKMLKAKSGGEATESFSSRPKRHYHCDTVEDLDQE